MASSNVEYYEKQKELQDSILENEQKRKRLEAQLQAYSRSDDKLAKLRAVKLQSYWKRICEDENKSKQRNAQLLRSMDRMEANMASLDARREKLKHMKQQYFDYIERTYPKWLELVQQQQQESQKQQQQQLNQQQQQQQQQYNQQQQQQYNQQQQQQQQQQYKQQQQQQQQQPQYNGTSYDNNTGYGVPPPPSNEETEAKQQEAFFTQVQVENHRNLYQDDESSEEAPPPLPSQPPPPAALSGQNVPEREYTNISEMRREQAASQQQPQSVTVHIPGQDDTGEGNLTAQSGQPDHGRLTEQPAQNWMAAERDASCHSVSFSEDVEVPIQPVQSVTVRQKTDPPAQPVQPMMGSVSDDDVSDFGSEPELPSGANIQHNTAVKPPSPVQVNDDLDDDDDDDDDTDQSPSAVHPDISTNGLYRLMKFVEEELLNALALEYYYRSRNPDESTKKDIIFKANNPGSTLATLDGELVSMVILQQLTLVLRRLPGGCMLFDTLLSKGANSLTEADIRDNLHRDAQALWDRLLEHFILLVKNRVMGTREVAHVFVPCLVHEGSEYQSTAVSVIENVIEQALDKTNGRSSPIQDSVTVDTARSSQQGPGDQYMNINLAVPPLMFGSLVDSKPFSDEESSVITQSMNTDVQKVPLNETDAYKNLLSGSKPAARQVSEEDDTDNSDNELEKQIASTLSPRSHGSKPKLDPYNEAPSGVPIDESHDLSHDQEPESELSSPIAPPVYVPTGAEQSTLKSVLGSTGGSSQQRKLAGLISSDLDTDTEVDLDHITQKKQEDDDDDFHDFYQ